MCQIAWGGGLNSKLSRASLDTGDDGTNLSTYVGQDIAKIDLGNIFTNGGTDSSNGSVYHQETRPNTGVIVVNTNVSDTEKNIKANAYDYVNLKYVQYNKNTGVLTNVLSAPPPGLFNDNSTTWPNWTPSTDTPVNDSNSTINLKTVFPTASILNGVKTAFGFDQDTITKTEWFQKTNSQAFTLDLSSLFINSIAELFNPNLVWGFGIYDLHTQVINTLNGAKAPEAGNEILYKGLYKIVVNDNALNYFPNPQFNNMPALRYIQATNNQIKAVGDFASYQNGNLSAKSIADNTPSSYFLYLQSLWNDTKTQNYPSVLAIKKWLMTTLPVLNRFSTATAGTVARGTIDDQLSFQVAISANNIYFPDSTGDVLKTGPSGSPIPNSTGSWGDLNFASVVLNVSKNFYEIDFSQNQIQRVHVTPTKFTYINFSSNQLKYVPPLALEPLPWNYLAAAVQAADGARNPIGPRKSGSRSVNTAQWSTNYNNNNMKPSESAAKELSFPVTQKLIAPTLQFSNNQILDWWPNNTKSDAAPNDGWYTWPNTTTSTVQGEPPVVNTIASTRAQAVEPYNRSTYSAANYSAYLHRNFLTARPEGGEYNQSSANLLGDWRNSGFTNRDDANFYRYYFANLDDNVELISQQNFTTELNFNLFSTESSKQKPFVLPGYETTGSKFNTSVGNFNQGIKPSSSNNATIDRYYDNLVPYLLGRTFPQNWTTANTWSGKNLQVQLLDDSGKNLLPNFATLNSQTVFSVLSAGTFTGSTNPNETNFVKQILGALPYGNGIYDNKVTGSTNVAAGIARNLFAGKNRVRLNIQQENLNLNYSYIINVLNNLNYTAQAKSPKGSDVKIEDIAASDFTKKTSFALASQISATDLLNELDTWLNASDYVKLYLENNPNALTITNYDIAKGEIIVRFNINDVNGASVSLADLNNNVMTITGFTALNSSFVNDSGTTITDTNNTELDKLTDHFLPKDLNEVREWIKNHYQVNWLGLQLKGGSGTTAGISSDRPSGYYKLSELQNDYITNLNVQANSGALSFTVIIPASAANNNVPLSRSYNLTSFLKFGMTIDTSSYDQASKQAVYDYQQKPELLKKFVKFAPTRTLNDGTTETKTAVSWWPTDDSAAKTDTELQTANLIPKYGKLEAVVASSSDQTAGILNFNVSLLDNSTPETMPLPVISTQTKTLTGLYNYDSQFSLKGTNTIGSTGVRYISDSSKSDSTVSQLNDVLKGYATSSGASSFKTWIEPLIDFSKSDQTYTAGDGSTAGTWSPSSLSDDQKNKLVYGFGTSVTLTTSDVSNNVAFDADSNTLSINNLYVKGGYLNGHFYDGTDTNAPVYALGNSVYSFFNQTTQSFNISSFKTTDTVQSEKWNKTTYQGANTYFQDALNEWKNLLPSEWAARLLSLKNTNRGSAVDAETYQVKNYDTLFSFLNHVVNTSTSNTLYQTRIDVSDVAKIQVNDFAGLVIIPANTLLIYNNYSSDVTSSPDALNAQPKPYTTEIKFQLADYKSRLTEEVKNALPWKLDPAVNAQFQAVDANAVQANLNTLLMAAQKLYNSSTTLAASDQTAALTAIEILANNFIADEYYTQPNARIFFTQKFGSLAPDGKADKYTQFDKITYENIDTINGTMKVTVTLKNYISGYDPATSKYTLEDKTKQFSLTNLLRQFGTPIWNNNDGQTVTSQVVNLAATAPELKLFKPGTDNPIFSYQTISRTEFNDETAEAYYNKLISNTENQLDDYIKIGPDGFKFANWSIVDNYGVSPNPVDNDQLKALTEKLTDAEIVIKKSNIHFSSRSNQIYFINPLIHFTGTYKDLAAKQVAMANIFDPLKNSPNHVPFGADNNFETNSLPNITLEGFAKVPTSISLKQDITKIQLGAETFNPNAVLPSQIYGWIQNNYSNATDLYNLFLSFYNLNGTSDLQKPITIVLNPAMVAVLNQANGSKDISQWISFNDGFGTINFNNAFFIFNTFNDKTQVSPTPNIVSITQFMPANSSDKLNLTNLRKSSFEKVEANQVVQGQISSNIATAINQLEANNYRLAHQLLMVNEIKTNLVNDESQLEINKVTSNLQSGELVIHYTVLNTYANGQRTNMSGVYVLSNFHSPIVSFLQAGLAPLLIGFAALVLGVYFINRRYRNNMNTRKYTKRKISNKKG